jgi:hypothetical protein
VSDWFRANILDAGRLPLCCFFVAFVLTFVFIRFSVRMIRAQVSWWPGNITPGGLHIHHVVFGTVAMVAGGVAGLAVPVEPVVWRAVCASLFGLGTALVLDEFALILHLDDVYWAEEGRLSVDAVAIATGVSGLLLLGGVPLLDDLTPFEGESALAFGLSIAAVIAIDLALAVITLIKGKLWTGLLGLFVPLLLIIGAIRLARPTSVWARRRYQARDGRPGRLEKLARAHRREERYREPVHRLKVLLQDAVAGAPTRPVEAEPNRVSEVAEDQHRPG